VTKRDPLKNGDNERESSSKGWEFEW